MPQHRFATQNCAVEWPLNSNKKYNDPFNEVEVNVVITDSAGGEYSVPAFWAGDHEWRVRFAPPAEGEYSYRVSCSDESNADLRAQSGVLQVAPYEGDNLLLQRGALRISQNQRYLEHADGTPFFWLGDTGWMSLCRRLSWPDDFQRLYLDRKAKGFSVVQIVAGLYPDMRPFDERGANEAGYPWGQEYSRINSAYFDMADLRIQWLIGQGIIPCIVGCWAYFLPIMGAEKLKKHWRNLVARWSAYPVVWCLAGEVAMQNYLEPEQFEQIASGQKSREEVMQEAVSKSQREGWAEIARYVREINYANHPITAHPSGNARDEIGIEGALDFNFLQTGHPDAKNAMSVASNTAFAVRRAVAQDPPMPVVNSEVGYEGILESAREEAQRFYFWSAFLQGAAGFTYGANGIWQINTSETPFGASPHGVSWGDRPWDEAYRLPGSSHVAMGKKILEQFEWWKFEPHPEWVSPHSEEGDRVGPFAAGIDDEIRVFYFPNAIAPWGEWPRLKNLESDVHYTATFYNPKDGSEYSPGELKIENGEALVPVPPVMHDWVLVVQRSGQ